MSLICPYVLIFIIAQSYDGQSDSSLHNFANCLHQSGLLQRSAVDVTFLGLNLIERQAMAVVAEFGGGHAAYGLELAG